MQYVGIDWAYRRAAWCAKQADGSIAGEGFVPADEDGLARLVIELGPGVRACLEMMSGAVWVRDRRVSSWSMNDCTPTLARLMPAASQPSTFWCVKVAGLISIVTSALGATVKLSRQAATSLPSCSASTIDGVPPPK